MTVTGPPATRRAPAASAAPVGTGRRSSSLAIYFVALVLVGLMVGTSYPNSAQPGDELKALREELKALKEGQTAIQKELEEIKTLLRARTAPPTEPQNVVLTTAGAPAKGDAHAKVTLIDFSDFQ